MNEKNLPTWLLIAVVVGLGELTYWLYTHFGFGVLAKTSLLLTVLTALVFIVLYLSRLFTRKRQAMQAQEKFEKMTD